MDNWDTTLLTLRNQDEERRDTAPLILEELQCWFETHLTPWADRWFGKILASADSTVTVNIWLTATPFSGSHWISTTPASFSLGRVLFLTGSLQVLRCASAHCLLEYSDHHWHASEELLALWMAEIDTVATQQQWAPVPSLAAHPRLRPGHWPPARRIAQGFALGAGMSMLVTFLPLLFAAHGEIPLRSMIGSLSVLVFSLPWALWP